MLYGDYIDLDNTDAKRNPAKATPARQVTRLLERFGRMRKLRRQGPDAPGDVDGHGTGVSTGRPLPARSFTPRAFAKAAGNPGAWTLALSVLGNTVAGGLFLGALLLAPQVLGRLFGLL